MSTGLYEIFFHPIGCKKLVLISVIRGLKESACGFKEYKDFWYD